MKIKRIDTWTEIAILLLAEVIPVCILLAIAWCSLVDERTTQRIETLGGCRTDYECEVLGHREEGQ